MIFNNHPLITVSFGLLLALFFVVDPLGVAKTLYPLLQTSFPQVFELPAVQAMLKFGALPESFTVAFTFMIISTVLIATSGVLLFPRSRIVFKPIEETAADSESVRAFALVTGVCFVFLPTIFFLTGTPYSGDWLSRTILNSAVYFSMLLATVWAVNLILFYYLFSYPFYLLKKHASK